MNIDPSRHFAEIEAPFGLPVADTSESFTLDIPVRGASVDDLELEVAEPLLILRRGGSEPETHAFVMLADVDTDSIRARLDDGVLRVSARRRWTRARRLPVMSNFLLGGRVGVREWEPSSHVPAPDRG